MIISSALRRFLVGQGSLKEALDGCVVRLYSGVAPTHADVAVPPGSVMLCEISVGGVGGTFEAVDSTPGLLLKAPHETWEGPVIADGTATWFRLEEIADPGTTSSAHRRIQGVVANAGGDMQISDVNLVAGATQNLDYFSVVMPAM